MTKDQERAQNELDSLRKDISRFYNSRPGKHQLHWIEQFMGNLVAEAIKTDDTTRKISLLDQAKGIERFKQAYIDTLTD